MLEVGKAVPAQFPTNPGREFTRHSARGLGALEDISVNSPKAVPAKKVRCPVWDSGAYFCFPSSKSWPDRPVLPGFYCLLDDL